MRPEFVFLSTSLKNCLFFLLTLGCFVYQLKNFPYFVANLNINSQQNNVSSLCTTKLNAIFITVSSISIIIWLLMMMLLLLLLSLLLVVYETSVKMMLI